MSHTEVIRIMLVDDHAMVRSGLKAFLFIFDDLELVAETSNGEEAVQLCKTAKPDVILMDMVMPGMDGVQTTRVIRDQNPEIQIIALTSFIEQKLVQDALKAGAIGYLLKDIEADGLAAAIRKAAKGDPVLSTEATRALIQSARSPEHLPGDDLTTRELEVLGLVVKGYNNNQIAKKLVISLSTAKFHVSSILSKLQVSSRTEAVSIALHNNLVK